MLIRRPFDLHSAAGEQEKPIDNRRKTHSKTIVEWESNEGRTRPEGTASRMQQIWEKNFKSGKKFLPACIKIRLFLHHKSLFFSPTLAFPQVLHLVRR
jgi:hypothetical protein